MKFNQRKYIKKFDFLGLVATLIFFVLAFYSSRLQIINHNIYNDEVNSTTIKQRKLAAPRGDIFDRNGVLLASTQYQNDLYIIPYYFDNDINIICADIKIDCGLLAKKLEKYPFNRILVARNISAELVENYEHISGLFIFRSTKRIYNKETATTHVVGYVGKINREMLEMNGDSLYADDDYVGQTGLENIYDHEIHGANGAEQYILMANGLELLNPNRFLSPEKIIIKPIKGNDLNLSIDDRLQLALATAMGDKRGGAVILDIHTGAVLAMYSSPTFDPMHVKTVFGDPNHPLINRAVSSYAPGSTFKLVTVLAALELGLADIHTRFECHGIYYFGGRSWHCWKHDGHGALGMRDAIKHSCDIYFYQLAQKVGLTNINEYAKLLGMGKFTGVDLDIESAGNLPAIKSSPGTLLNTVIGQGVVQVTPLQLANAYATIVNGGELHMPKIAQFDIPATLRENHFKKQTIDFIMDALYAVVNEDGGTGYYSKSSIVEIAGKTGTAQVAGLDKKKLDNAWFTGYYPVVEPQIVVCVFIEQGAHGSSIIPIANRAIEEYAKEHPAGTLMKN